MAAFFVHWNRIRKRVRIHYADCGACNHGEGMHRGKIDAGRGDTYDWIPAATYAEALKRAAIVASKISTKAGNCGMCSPQLGTRKA
jgi:hypothetical protein